MAKQGQADIASDGNDDWIKDDENRESEREIHAGLTRVKAQKQLTSPGANEYRRTLRAAVRGLYQGESDMDWFADAMEAAINHSFQRAFREGADICGIEPQDYSEDEQSTLDETISEEFRFVEGLGVAVVAARAEEKGLKGLFVRLELWIQRYLELRTLAMQMACADQKLRWGMKLGLWEQLL